jgi:beta-galactosidase
VRRNIVEMNRFFLLLSIFVLSLLQPTSRTQLQAAGKRTLVASVPGPLEPYPESSEILFQHSSERGLEYSADTLYFNGQPVHLWAGELPYYRVDPALWDQLLEAARAAGVRFISAYVPWNLHEPVEGRFDFNGAGGEGRRNLVRFIELLAAKGMYFIPKPGPFICAEVQHGGLPDWLTRKHPEILMRDQHGRKVRFRQDGTVLPDHLNPTYVEYVRRWYSELYEQVLAKYQYAGGPIVALQVENELLYSTSGLADPFSWGFTPVVEELYRNWLRGVYGDIRSYNKDHGSAFVDFIDIRPPKSRDWRFRRLSDWLVFQDWVRFKNWYGAAIVRSYADILQDLGVSVPLYHNAGMLEDEAPMAFGALSGEIWLGVNFWLNPHPMYSTSSYVRGVRRLKQLRGSQPDRPSITPEVNWGWGNAGEFDFLTRYTLPYSKATDIYPLADGSSSGALNGRPYSTSPEPYPGNAPIDDLGNPRPAYQRLLRLIRYTDSEGETFARAQPVSSISIAAYTPYNTPMLYTTYGRRRSAELENVFSSAVGSNEFLQELMVGLIDRDAEFDIVDLQGGSLEVAAHRKLLIVLSQEIMEEAAQAALVDYVDGGGTLVLMPTLPSVDLTLRPLSLLKESLLPELTVEETRSLEKPQEFRTEEEGRTFSGSRVAHRLKIDDPACRTLATTVDGNIAAVEKTVGSGKVIYLGTYCTDPDLYIWLARRERIPIRYAYSDLPRIETVPIFNLEAGVIYLFLLNRSGRAVSAQVHYRDHPSSKRWRILSASVGGHSVSILKVREGALESASLYGGGRGIVVRSDALALSVDRATAADLLGRGSGDLLFWADRPTEVCLEGLAGDGRRWARVLNAAGAELPAVVTEGGIRFSYWPSGQKMEYYRILAREEP